MLDAMPRTRMTNVSAAQWSPNGGAMGQSDLTQAGAYAFGENVFSPAVQRQRIPRSPTTSPRR
jgi:glutamine synthetase